MGKKLERARGKRAPGEGGDESRGEVRMVGETRGIKGKLILKGPLSFTILPVCHSLFLLGDYKLLVSPTGDKTLKIPGCYEIIKDACLHVTNIILIHILLFRLRINKYFPSYKFLIFYKLSEM